MCCSAPSVKAGTRIIACCTMLLYFASPGWLAQTQMSALRRSTVELTRSGGFGLVVLDLGPETIGESLDKKRRRIAVPFITKLVGLAQKSSTAVVVLTEKTKESSSLSSLVSLRCEARRLTSGSEVEIEILKDKRRGPGRRYREVCGAPAGLR